MPDKAPEAIPNAHIAIITEMMAELGALVGADGYLYTLVLRRAAGGGECAIISSDAELQIPAQLLAIQAVANQNLKEDC